MNTPRTKARANPRRFFFQVRGGGVLRGGPEFFVFLGDPDLTLEPLKISLGCRGRPSEGRGFGDTGRLFRSRSGPLGDVPRATPAHRGEVPGETPLEGADDRPLRKLGTL